MAQNTRIGEHKRNHGSWLAMHVHVKRSARDAAELSCVHVCHGNKQSMRSKRKNCFSLLYLRQYDLAWNVAVSSKRACAFLRLMAVDTENEPPPTGVLQEAETDTSWAREFL